MAATESSLIGDRGGGVTLPMLQKVGVDAWLRAHGKTVRPELTKKQKQELKECFDLIDADGSGAIDAEELVTAFNVLGMRVKKSEVEKMLAEVDADGSGEVEYPEFVQIMTSKLDSQVQEGDSEEKASKHPLPFQLLAQAYRRKKLMEAVMGGDKAAQERLKAKAEEAEAERQAVLVAMEAEKQNPVVSLLFAHINIRFYLFLALPSSIMDTKKSDAWMIAFNIVRPLLQTLRYDDKKMRTISDVKYHRMKRAEARRKLGKEETLPDYIVEHLDDELKLIILESCDTQKDGLREYNTTPAISQSKDPKDMIKLPIGGRTSQEASPMSFYKQELAELGHHRSRVRHKPVLERQLLHLRAVKSIQEYLQNQASSA